MAKYRILAVQFYLFIGGMPDIISSLNPDFAAVGQFCIIRARHSDEECFFTGIGEHLKGEQ